MKLAGGCYCGAVRYSVEGEPAMKAQCHCRECQYITGGGPNYFMMMPLAGFAYTQGAPKSFTRSDIPHPVTREFCAECGTHLATKVTGMDAFVLKIGALDEPAAFGAPDMAIFTVDAQPFHMIPDDKPSFERLPG